MFNYFAMMFSIHKAFIINSPLNTRQLAGGMKAAAAVVLWGTASFPLTPHSLLWGYSLVVNSPIGKHYKPELKLADLFL